MPPEIHAEPTTPVTTPGWERTDIFICEKGGRIPDFDWPEGAMIPQEALPDRSPIWRSGSSDFADSVQPPGGKNSCFP